MVANQAVPMTWYGSHGLVLSDQYTGPTLMLNDNTRQLLRDAAKLSKTANNPMTRLFANQLLFEFASTILFMREFERPIDPADDELMIEIGQTQGTQYAIFISEILKPDITPTQIIELIEQKEYLNDLPLHWHNDIQHLLGTSYFRSGDSQQAITILEQALAKYPTALNSNVLLDLAAIYAQEGMFDKYSQLRTSYPDLEASALSGFDERCAAFRGRSCLVN